MTEAKHTPGPWKISGATNVFRPGADGANVCSVSEPRASKTVGYTEVELGSKDFYEACANATLIAAAPDMLAALRLVWDKVLTEYHSPDSYVRQQVETAIAKATGEAQ